MDFLTAKNDKVFKAIFSDPSDTLLLEILLSEILEKKVSNIIFMNSELHKRNVIERAKTVDLFVDVDGVKTHIEMNSEPKTWLHLRNLNFFTTIFNKETTISNEYDVTIPFLHIDFTYKLSKRYPIKTEYFVQSKDNFLYIENFKIIEFNMDLIKKECYNDINQQENSLYKHLAILDYNEKELNELPKGDVFMDKYKEKVMALNKDEQFKSFLSYEEDQLFQKNTEIHEAEKRGQNLGKEIGEKIGKEMGQQQEKEEIAKSMLMKTPELGLKTIADVTGLSLEKVKELQKELN